MLSISASTSNRLLKKAPNFVLGSSKSSTYPRGYAYGFDSPAASLDGLFEQPVQTHVASASLPQSLAGSPLLRQRPLRAVVHPAGLRMISVDTRGLQK